MARGNKNLSSFGDVADISVNNNGNHNNSDNINNNDNDNANINVNVNDISGVKHASSVDESVSELLEKKTAETVLVGVYFQKDIARALDKLGKKGGRGAKSRIVNEAVKKFLAENGLL